MKNLLSDVTSADYIIVRYSTLRGVIFEIHYGKRVNDVERVLFTRTTFITIWYGSIIYHPTHYPNYTALTPMSKDAYAHTIQDLYTKEDLNPANEPNIFAWEKMAAVPA